LQVGDQVEIIPNHSCSTANNTGWYTCVRGDEIVDFIAVDARENSKKKGTL
jgi:D-serine deaminase-like pyridoxal phosphate-dependent protein